jgi:hypothetical protein
MAAIEARLERMADRAEAALAPNAVAVLAAQRFRGVETGARLAGIGGFAAGRGTDAAGGAPAFSVNIIFSSGQRETITVAAECDSDSTDLDQSDRLHGR